MQDFFFWDYAQMKKVDTDLEFYSKAIYVLFDLPDFLLVSTYVLLLLLWAESFLSSRKHWLSSRNYRHFWHSLYLFFNTVLYGAQLFIYVFVFFGDLGIYLLYLVPALLTIVVPVVHLCLYVFMSLRFAGFPLSSISAGQRLKQITRVTLVWSLGRVLWSLVILSTLSTNRYFSSISTTTPHTHQFQDDYFQDNQFRYNDEEGNTYTMKTNIATTSSLYYADRIGPVAIIGLFLLTEVCPIVFTLDSSLLSTLDYDDYLAHSSSSSAGGGRSDNNNNKNHAVFLSSRQQKVRRSSYYASIAEKDDKNRRRRGTFSSTTEEKKEHRGDYKEEEESKGGKVLLLSISSSDEEEADHTVTTYAESESAESEEEA
mmetsp:Transcript_7603/g.10577  ORF Transcript_7603/g.10577 Transcript_7603/m.10577 type:complete len:371 (+) Transcript_7603:12-1124(+)